MNDEKVKAMVGCVYKFNREDPFSDTFVTVLAVKKNVQGEWWVMYSITPQYISTSSLRFFNTNYYKVSPAELNDKLTNVKLTMINMEKE